MTKMELIESLARQQKISTKEAKSIVETILATMTDALLQGHTIEIRGFGSFQVREYDAYIGRNPKTGEAIQVGTKKLPFFKPGKDLRKQMNKNKADT
jgi:integration host factor subunit beta